MADNVGYTPGTGETIATDDVAGVQFQRLKLDLGGNGVSLPLVAGSTTAANALPVISASDDPVVTATGAVSDAPWNGVGNATLVAAMKGVWTAITNNSLPAGSNVIGQVTANAGTNLNTSALALDATLTGNNQRSRITDGANIAAVKAASTAPVAADPALVVAISPNTATLTVSVSALQANPNAGGHTLVLTALSLGATTATQIKGTVASLGQLSIRNNSAAARWVKIFLLPSASVTMGSTNANLNYGLAAGQSREIMFPLGLRSGTGLTYAVTTGQALNDNTAGVAGDVELTVVYI